MTLEWLRRRDPVLDEHLRTYLFTTEPVTEIEARGGGRRRAPAWRRQDRSASAA